MGLWGYFTDFAGENKETAGSKHRLYAVGDIHGCAVTLRKVLEKIHADIARHPQATSEIIFMADYCDRGPDTRGVLDMLCAEKQKNDGVKRTFLKGNHDAEFISFLNAQTLRIAGLHLSNMIQVGGLETLASYGAYIPQHLMNPRKNGAVNAQNIHVGRQLTAHMWSRMRANVPAEHREFLMTLATSYTSAHAPHLFFCHAGVNPQVALEKQDPAVLLGMEYEREANKETAINRVFARTHGKSGLVQNHVIVCGHHSRSLGEIEGQENTHGLIFTDAGACMGGELAVVVFVNGKKKLCWPHVPPILPMTVTIFRARKPVFLRRGQKYLHQAT